MINKLEPIVLQKHKEVAALHALVKQQPQHPIAKILSGEIAYSSENNFKSALRGSTLSVIAEIKRKSPSKGHLAEIRDPVLLASTYIEGGANALSILTESLFFNGHLDDLTQVAPLIKKPLLRKDFIIHEIQIAESIAAGADAILCIVAVLGKETKTMLDHAKRMGIPVLVEVHNKQELDIALDSGAEIIGINNRNLSTFQVDVETAFNLLAHIPKTLIKVAESGILEPALAKKYYQAGFDAVLIGEALVTSVSPEAFIRECKNE